MLEVLEAPPTAFTPDTGREAGKRSAELRQQQAKENETLRALLANKPITTIVETKPVNEEVNRQIALDEELIAYAYERLKACPCDKCKREAIDDKAAAALLREIRGLQEHLCRLHNIPQAPTTKATPAKQSRRSDPMPEPTIPQAVVVQPDITKPQ